jgi:hypothetical protein
MQRFRIFSDLTTLDLVGDPHHTVVRANCTERQPPLGGEGGYDHIAVRYHQVFLTAAWAGDGKTNTRYVHRVPLKFRHLEWIVRDRIVSSGKTSREPRPGGSHDKRDEESIESKRRGELGANSKDPLGRDANLPTLVSRILKPNQMTAIGDT